MQALLKRWRFVLRLDQLAVTLIPIVIGFLALLNDTTMSKSTIKAMVFPLITMQGQVTQTWRALPASWVPSLYFLMVSGEFLVGLLALIGFMSMLKNINKDAAVFEASKRWIYLACGWGLCVWGLGFFELGGDWFLAWQNNSLSSFQSGTLMYVIEVAVTFIYLKLMRE